jgi:hypothetical protein
MPTPNQACSFVWTETVYSLGCDIGKCLEPVRLTFAGVAIIPQSR